MNRAKTMLLVVVGLMLCGAPCAVATTPSTVVAGTCRPKMPSYTTISAAVAAVPSGGTVLVCPGTHAEQVVISTPLTLQGISNGDADRAVITVPGGGLSPSFTDIFGGPLFAQVLVTTAPVNITNITVDGTGNSVSAALLAGIAYESGSSGTVNQVAVRNEIENGAGFGIWAENAIAVNESVTVENSSVHDFDAEGIAAFSNQSPSTLMVTIKGNEVTTNSGRLGIDVEGINGSVSGNDISGEGTSNGIFEFSGSSVSITGNTVTGTSFAINVTDANVVKSNVVLNSGSTAILVQSAGATVQNNVIGNTPVGIEFLCLAPTVSGNTIRDANTALSDVPLSFSPLSNTYQNVDTIRSGGFCTAARVKALAAEAAKRLARFGVH